MSTPQILVHNQPFFAQVEQQEVFRMALREVCDAPLAETMIMAYCLSDLAI